MRQSHQGKKGEGKSGKSKQAGALMQLEGKGRHWGTGWRGYNNAGKRGH